MADGNTLTRLRGAFRNSLVWGVGWGAFGSAVATAAGLIDNIPFWNALLDGVGMGVRIGFIGAVAGAAFFAFISGAYRGKRLPEIGWLRFGLGGAMVAGLFVPSFLQAMSVLSGGGLVPWPFVFNDFVYSALFGGITAAGTMIIALRDEAAHPVTVEALLDRMERDVLGPGGAARYRKAERARSAEYR